MPYDPDYDSSQTSSHADYDFDQTFVPYSTGPKDRLGQPMDPRNVRKELFDERRRAKRSQEQSKFYSRRDSSIPSQLSHASGKTIRPVDQSSQASTARLNQIYDPPQPQSVRSHKSASTAQRPRSPSGSVPVPRGPGSFESSRHQDDRFMEPFDRLPTPDHNFPQAFTTPGFDPQLRDTESRCASSPQGPGKGLSAHELARMMNNASLSESSGGRGREFPSGRNNMRPVSAQRYTERYPVDPWGLSPSEAIKDEMRARLKPLEEAALHYRHSTDHRSNDTIRDRGKIVIRREGYLAALVDGPSSGGYTSSPPPEPYTKSVRQSSDPYEGTYRMIEAPRQPKYIADRSYNGGASPARSATGSAFGYESLPNDGAGPERQPSFAGSQRSGYSSRHRVDSTHGPPEEDSAPSHPHGSIHGSTQRGPSEPRGHRPSMYSERPHAPRRRRYADSEYGIQ